MKKRILSALMALAVCLSSIGAVSVMAEAGDLILSDTTTVNVDNTDTCLLKLQMASITQTVTITFTLKQEHLTGLK